MKTKEKTERIKKLKKTPARAKEIIRKWVEVGKKAFEIKMEQAQMFEEEVRVEEYEDQSFQVK